MTQQSLFQTVNHSNRGRGFESELEAVHDYYRLNRIADVVKNPSEWIYIGEREYLELKRKCDEGVLSRGMVAVCDDLRKMKRVASQVDFSGGGRGFSICFDAKESAGKSFPLANFKSHQIRRLVQSARCGCVSGFLIKMSDLDRVFFVPAAYAAAREENLIRKKIGKTRAPVGTASISLADLETHCTEIKRARGGIFDWHTALVIKN